MIGGTARTTFDLPLVVAGLLLWTASEDGRNDDATVAAAIRVFSQLPPEVRAAAYDEGETA